MCISPSIRQSLRAIVLVALAVLLDLRVMHGEAAFDEVAAVLARHCVACHNDIDQQGGFSLQTRESLLASDFVQPGDRGSHLLSVIGGGDQPPTMPKDAEPLAADDIRAIGRWIEAGAPWPGDARIEPRVSDFHWWSFQPLVRPEVPTSSSHWPRTPIDAFILAGLESQGLTPAEPADRRTLIRRLTYDLVGLPPTPTEVADFVHDRDPAAYEKLVDRLLDSQHYGERWAQHWLDVVKYADTCGYDKDKLRPNAWPYRDYVIRSLNDDKPYGRFVQEQIAGDVLFPGHSDGILGLGFIAAGPWDFIGHVEVPESKSDGKVARNLDRDEMVSNTFNTFCSVTIQCARCHHHKFDPFTQQHYYSLQSIFAAVDRAERPYDLDPDVERQRRELAARLAGLRDERAALERDIAAAGGPELVEVNELVAELQRRAGVTKQPAFGYHSSIASSAEQAKWVEVDLGREVPLARIVLRPCHDEFAGIGAGFGFPKQYQVEIRSGPGDTEPAAEPRIVQLSDEDFANPGLAAIEIPVNGQTARAVRVTALRLAERQGDYIFALAELQIIDSQGHNVALGGVVSALDTIEAPPRWGRQNLVDGVWAQATDPQADALLVEARGKRDQILARIETPARRAGRAAIEVALEHAAAELNQLPVGRMVYAAATHFQPQGNFQPTAGIPRAVHVLHRGEVNHPLQPVAPGLLPLSQGADWQLDQELTDAQRRAALARWLTRPDHPLVWRSIVNRVWQHHFGQGLVATPNDFGRMGAVPTHPELLDWLAAEFRDDDQSLKKLHRWIVTSSVYRQAADFDEAKAAIDGGNKYLWRMPRRRLSAEEIRDSTLAVSGALDPKMGGPGYYLFQLEKTEHSPHYEYHKFDPADPHTHRRSIYRFLVRSQPDPFMTTLDCADSSQSTPKRIETLTSLQALSLLNNRFNLVMAQRFAERLRAEDDQLAEQIERAMWLVAARSPSHVERTELARYAQAHGLENLCRMLLNLNEFVFID
jgi:cytochrome c553